MNQEDKIFEEYCTAFDKKVIKWAEFDNGAWYREVVEKDIETITKHGLKSI